MSKKMCKHNRMTEVLPLLWIGGTKKHTEYTGDKSPTGTEHVRVVAAWTAPEFLTADVFYFVCPNYGIPNATADWWLWEIKRYNNNAKRNVTTVVTDLGGHGRSGLYCAILMAHVLGLTGQEAIAKLRQMHCEQAVETAEQEAYVIRIVDEIRNWKG